MWNKFKYIFLPFLIALVGLTVGYTFLHWLIFIELELVSPKEMITNFGVPMALVGIVAIFMLRPRLKMLRLEAKRGSYIDFYTLILAIVLLIPLLIAQEYIVTASGSLTELTSVNEIEKTKPTKYYTLKNYYIDKYHASVNATAEVGGKHNENLGFCIYIAMPVFDKAADTSMAAPLAWMGIKYSKTISNNLGADEKDVAYKIFADDSQKDFDTKRVQDFVYLDRIGNSDARDGYLEAINKNEFFQHNQTILVPVNDPFEERNGSKLFWILLSSAIGTGVFFVMIAIPMVNTQRLNDIKKGKPDGEAIEDIKDLLSFITPKKGFFITPLLIYANVGIYVLMVIMGLGFISFSGADLVAWGGNYGPLTTSGDWWRLLTNTFLHGGFIHVFSNIIGLVIAGVMLEPLLGKARYLGAYIVTGILASATSTWWHTATVSVGASGAIFGLYGVFVAMVLTGAFPKESTKPFLIGAAVFIGYNLLMGLAGGIDNAAHIGGLVSGFVIGLILRPTLKKVPTKSKRKKRPVLED